MCYMRHRLFEIKLFDLAGACVREASVAVPGPFVHVTVFLHWDGCRAFREGVGHESGFLRAGS